MFKKYFRDWNNLRKVEQQFHKEHWLGEIILTVGGFVVCGASLAIIEAYNNAKQKKEQNTEEPIEEPAEEQAV